MRITLGKKELAYYIETLLSYNFPLIENCHGNISAKAIDSSLERLEYSFSHIKLRYYRDQGETLFDPLHGDHLCAFLWFLSNTVAYECGDEKVAIRLSNLNKRLHGVDLFYTVQMPEIFLLVHPVGSVYGAARYGNYFVGYQNCTIGADGTEYPEMGEGVVCYSRTSIIGKCRVGNNVVIGANTFILNCDISSDTLVLGSYPDNRFISRNESARLQFYD